MNILAIDTATEYLSIALVVGSTRQHYIEKVGNQQAKNIIPRIQELLHLADITVADLNLIAYNQGPGSFTGLRIGLGVAIGIAIGQNINLMPIPAFATFATASKAQLNNAGNVLVGLDARMHEIYLAGINPDTLDYVLDPCVISPAAIENIHNLPLIGDGFKNYFDDLKPYIQNSKQILDMPYPSALNLLDIVAMNKCTAIAPEQAELLYLRNKVALTTQERAQQHL